MQKLILITIALIATTQAQSCLSLAPVCGVNNVTYANACTCERAEVAVAYENPCGRQSQPIQHETFAQRVETPYELDVVAVAPEPVRVAPVVVETVAPVVSNWGWAHSHSHNNGNWGWNHGNNGNWGWNHGNNGNWGWNHGNNGNWGWNHGNNGNWGWNHGNNGNWGWNHGNWDNVNWNGANWDGANWSDAVLVGSGN